jgi:hypothetical protein
LTQTEVRKTRTISGVVDSVGRIKKTPDGDKRNVSIQEQHLDFPSKNDAVAGLADEIQKLEGQMVTVELVVEKLKTNKDDDGKFGSYWWNISRIIKDGESDADRVGQSEDDLVDSTEAGGDPDVGTRGRVRIIPDDDGPRFLEEEARKPVTDSGKFKGSPFPPVEGIVQGHLEKLAMDWFTASFTPTELRQIPHNIALHTIRLLRDELFHDLKSLSIAPTHYCYEHEMSRARAKSGNWGHPLEGGEWCVEPNEPPPPLRLIRDEYEPDRPSDEELADLPISDEVDF